jgi:hypothetical protein
MVHHHHSRRRQSRLFNLMPLNGETLLTESLRPPPGFVELPLVAQPVLGPNCTVELARGEGARMTIRWEGKEGQDLVGLAEAFWRSGA